MIGELILGLHLMSAHAPAIEGQNNANLGAYAIYNGWTAGAYRNTLRRSSVYMGYQFEAPGLPLSLTVGAVSGYQIIRTPMIYRDRACANGGQPGDGCYGIWTEGMTKRKWAPMLAPSAHYGPARLWLIPEPRGAVLHLSVEREF